MAICEVPGETSVYPVQGPTLDLVISECKFFCLQVSEFYFFRNVKNMRHNYDSQN